MTTRRALTRLAFLAMAGSALMSSTGIANAITPQDDAYLAKLSAVGLTWPPTTEEALIGEAHLICYDLTWGWQPQQIADDIHDHLNKRGVTLLDVGTMVDAAHKTYCPGNVCDAPLCAPNSGLQLADHHRDVAIGPLLIAGVTLICGNDLRP